MQAGACLPGGPWSRWGPGPIFGRRRIAVSCVSQDHLRPDQIRDVTPEDLGNGREGLGRRQQPAALPQRDLRRVAEAQPLLEHELRDPAHPTQAPQVFAEFAGHAESL